MARLEGPLGSGVMVFLAVPEDVGIDRVETTCVILESQLFLEVDHCDSATVVGNVDGTGAGVCRSKVFFCGLKDLESRYRSFLKTELMMLFNRQI